MRCTVAPSARESSARSAMPKFECSWSGGTHRSSVNQKSTPDQSSRAAAARSYAARGVDPPVSATWPPAATRRSAASRAGSSETLMSAFTAAAPRRRSSAAGVGRVAQERLADPLAEDAALAARGAEDRPALLLALLVRAGAPRGRPARGRARSTCRTPCRSPRRPGRARPGRGRARAPAPRRRGVRGRVPRDAPFASISVPGLPAEPRRQPAEEQHARPRATSGGGGSSPSRSCPARRASCGGSNVAATRSRHGVLAQPRQVHHVGVLAPAPSRAAAPRAASGSFTESISTTCARCSSASTASGCPCGDHTTVCEVGHHQRVDDRVERSPGASRRPRARRARA